MDSWITLILRGLKIFLSFLQKHMCSALSLSHVKIAITNAEESISIPVVNAQQCGEYAIQQGGICGRQRCMIDEGSVGLHEIHILSDLISLRQRMRVRIIVMSVGGLTVKYVGIYHAGTGIYHEKRVYGSILYFIIVEVILM